VVLNLKTFFMQWNLFFVENVYRITAVDQSGGLMDCAVHFGFAWSAGFHVKVYCRNALIGDLIHKREPSIASAMGYAQQFLDSPTDYSEFAPPIPGV
jgi:hypothetical protein